MRKKSNKPEIRFFNESGIDIPVTLEIIGDLVSTVFSREKKSCAELEAVYVNEEKIVEINTLHLGKDYITDIITYHYQEFDDEPVEGTIFCCAQRIFEQARELNLNASTEFNRVLIHGLLHLCGYDDKTESEKELMTSKENEYLALLP